MSWKNCVNRKPYVIIDAGYFSYIIVIGSNMYVNFYLITLVSVFIQQPKLGLRGVFDSEDGIERRIL